MMLWKERTSEARILYSHMRNHAWSRHDIAVAMVGRFANVLVASGRRGRCLLQHKCPSSFFSFFSFFFLLPITAISLSSLNHRQGVLSLLLPASICYL